MKSIENLKLKKQNLDNQIENNEKILIDKNLQLMYIDDSILSLENKLQHLSINQKQISNKTKLLINKRREILIKNILTFIIFTIIGAGFSTLIFFTGISSFIISCVVCSVASALGVIINGVTDYNEYKNALESYDYESIKNQISKIKGELNLEYERQYNTQKSISNLTEQNKKLIYERNNVNLQIEKITEIFVDVVNQLCKKDNNINELINNKTKVMLKNNGNN